MSEDSWPTARLIPTTGITGAEEQRHRAASALLAVLAAVPEFGRAVTQPFGAPPGPVRAFVEVPLGADFRADGLVRVTRGRRTWTALLAVATGTGTPGVALVERYLDVAREQCFDAVITISTELPAGADRHPVPVAGGKLKRVALYHLPWLSVLSEAVRQKEYAEQPWLLGELVRYLEHPASGAMEFRGMGPSWVAVCEAVAAERLGPTDGLAVDAARRFDALLRHACLRLGRSLGTEVVPVRTRADIADPAGRTQAVVAELTNTGRMSGAIRVPGAVGPLRVTADLRAGQVTCAVDVDAPGEGRPETRVNWLARQLADAPGTVRIEVHPVPPRGPGTAELLYRVRESPELLIGRPGRELRAFRLAQARPTGTGGDAFVAALVDAVESFYFQVVRDLKPVPAQESAASTVSTVDSLASSASKSATGMGRPNR